MINFLDIFVGLFFLLKTILRIKKTHKSRGYSADAIELKACRK
jgi:hypothetical protein